jgi:hypothetical protein
MKFHRTLCFCVSIALPPLAVAKLPPSPAFGQLEGMLDFCAQADSESAVKYKEFKQHLVQDVPEKEVAAARMSTEYKEAYDAINAALGQAPKDQAVKACTSLLESKKQPNRPRSSPPS